MNRLVLQSSLVVTLGLALSGCSSMNVFKDSAPASQVATAEPTLPPAPTSPTGPAGTMSAAQIKSLLTGKSWRWRGPKNAGVTLYASDGTSLVEVAGKGTTQGKWYTKDGQLCESFSPAPFLPNGDPEHCQAFTGTNGSYHVGQASFQLAS